MRRVALGLTLLLCSCAWASDRGADAADVLVLEGGLGLGLSVDAKASELLHVGAGYADMRKAGLRGRTRVWMRDREAGLPASLLPWVGALRDGQPWRLGHLHLNASELWWGGSAWRLADLELGLFAGVFGLRVGLSPGELLDLLAGLVGLDPAGDDDGPRFEPGPGEALEEGTWLVGDLHDHCDPPDGGHAPVTPEETHALAEANGLDFVGIHPHLWLEGMPLGMHFDLHALARQVRALEGRGPIVIPGLEVMVRGGRRGDDGPLGPRGHALLMFRELDEAYDLGPVSTATSMSWTGPRHDDERSWVEGRLALPRERRLWVPAHPWPHERILIPVFTDHAQGWKQLDERAAGEATLAGRTYAVTATPWAAGDGRRDDSRRPWRLARYRLDPALRATLPALPLRDATVQAQGGPAAVAALASELASLLPGEEASQAGQALEAAARRELASAPEHGLRLEVVLDVGRSGWLWLRLQREADGAESLTLSLGSTPRAPLHDVPVDGYEALSGLVHLAGLAVGRRGDELDVPHVLAATEARMLAERRPLVALAGSDNHRDLIFPTLHVFARERSRAAIFDALRAGRVVIGGPAAGSLRARTDAEPTVWRAVGADLRAARWVELAWEGEAELFVDGEALGARRGGLRHEVRPGEPHVYRIVRGASWSGWVRVNLEGP